MNWVVTRNNKPVAAADLPELTMRELREEILLQTENGRRVVSFFPLRREKGILIHTVLADDEDSNLLISTARMEEGGSYPAVTPAVPAFHLFERALYEESGILPEGHPWLKPVRFPSRGSGASRDMGEYPFFRMEGEEIHEVAVGPVHAGVIEPGHFRFMCHGEMVYHLEIQLGYQHRGIEKLILHAGEFAPHFVESAAGDSAVAYASAYAGILEALGGAEISRRAMSIRAIALELERAGAHIGDLGAICNDIGYAMGYAVFGALRTLVINTLLEICGSRFGRGLVRPGGVKFDIDAGLRERARRTLEKAGGEVERMGEIMFNSPSVLSRLEHTGVVTPETARAIGMTGPAGRASGVALDVRADHPFGMYRSFPVHTVTMESGDVFARAYIRYVEIRQSLQFIMEQLGNFPEGDTLLRQVEPAQGDAFVASLVEGWRGEIVHCARTDSQGGPAAYRIKDPSFNNWYGLALAVRNNGISDFPLCNKSFDLSYCGHDL